jgi:hypothetical protein
VPLEPEVVPQPGQEQGRVVYRIHDLLGCEIDLTPDRRLPVRLDAAIVSDVEAWWHLRAGEAAQMLVDRAIAGQKSPKMTQEGLSTLSGPLPIPRSRNAA